MYHVPSDNYTVKILGWERRPVFYDQPMLEKYRINLVQALDELKDFYKSVPDAGDQVAVPRKIIARHFMLERKEGRFVIGDVACRIMVDGLRPSGFLHYLIVGLSMVEEQILRRGPVELRAQIGRKDAHVDLVCTMSIGRATTMI